MRDRLLRSYARWIVRRKGWIVLGACLLTVGSLVISLLFLKAQTGVTDLYAKDTPVNRQFLSYVDKFGAAENLIVVFEGKDPRQVRQAMDTLGDALKSDPYRFIDYLFYRADLSLFIHHALEFLSEEQAQALLKQIENPDGWIREIFAANNINDFFALMNRSLEKGLQGSTPLPAGKLQDIQKLVQPILVLKEYINGWDLSKAAVSMLLMVGSETRSTMDPEGYLQTDDKKMYVMIIHPLDPKQDYKVAQRMIQWTRAEIEKVEKQFPTLTIGLTGGPALNSDQFEVSKNDMVFATLFAYFSTGIIFILAFRSFSRPLLGLLTLTLTLSCVFGATTLTIGHLNIFSMSFIVILVGQGTYYGVHVVARYEEELLKGRTPPEAMEETLVHVFGNITTSTVTTAAAFFTTTLVPLKGFAELGWIAGMGMILSSLGMQLLLPAFLLIYDRKGARDIFKQKKIPILNFSIKTKWITLATAGFARYAWVIILLVVSGAGWGAYRFYSPQYGITFDSNLLNLQAKDTEAVRYEKKLMETSLSPRAAVFMASSPDEARRLADRAKAQPTVQRVEWLGSVFPMFRASEGTQKKLRRSIHSLPLATLSPPNLSGLKTELGRLKQNLEKVQERALGHPQGAEILSETEEGIVALEDIISKLPVATMEKFQQTLFAAIRGSLLTSAKSSPLQLEDIPRHMRAPFLSPDKTYAVYAFPSGDIWEQEPLENFVSEMRKADPKVTGPPVMFFEILQIVRHSYFKAAAYSALAIFLIFLIDFRSLKYALMASVPLALGVFSLFGFMSLIKLPFNTANMIALPMILGIGADNGVHLIHRFIEEKGRDLRFLFRSTGKALVVTYLDTLTSFFGLAIASHQGMAKMGQVVILGITCTTFCGMLVLPAILSLIIKRRTG